MLKTPQLLSSFFESMSIGIRITDAEGQIVMANAACCALYGYTREELLGKNFTSFLAPEYREAALNHYKAAFSETVKETPPTHWVVQRKDGKNITVAASSYIVQAEEGLPCQVAMVREVNQVLQSMNPKEFYVSVLNNVEDSVVVVGLSGSIVYTNRGTIALYQLNEEEVLDQPAEKLWPDQNISELFDFFREGNKQYDIESWPYQPQAGPMLYINIKISPLLDEQQVITGLIFMSQDVTEKHKNEQEVLQQRNMLASLLGSQSNFLVRFSPEGHLSYTNKAFSASGIFTESMQEKPFQDLIYPADRQLWQNHLRALLQTGTLQRVEFRMLKNSGGIIWTKWEFVRLPDTKGHPALVQGMGSDISDRKKTEKERDELLYHTQALNEELQTNEEELRQNLERTVELNHFIQKSKRRFQSLLENSFEAIMLFDEAGYITYASSSVEKTLGYPAEEMLGKKGMTYIHEDDKVQSKEKLAQAVKKPGNRVYILQRVKRKAGSYIWTESYTTNLLHDENVRGMVSNFRDVTERIEAEEKLRDSEASLNLAQHIAKLGSAEFNLITGEVKHSSGVFAIYDFDLERFSEKEFNGFEYTHPDDVEKTQALFNNYKEPGPNWLKAIAHTPKNTLKEIESTPFEYRIISALGRIKYLRTNSRFIKNSEGELIKLLLTIQDITEEKQRERLLDETSRISKIGGWELDLQNKQISWTLQTYSLFEISPTEELTIERATAFYLPAYQPVLRKAFHTLITEGTPFDLELKMATASQNKIWVRMMGQAEMVNGKVVLAKGTMQDITDRKNTEQEIREYAERLRLANEAAGIGAWDWDLKHNKMVWDQQMREIYDIPQGEEAGYTHFKNALHPEDKLNVEKLLETTLEKRKMESEFRIITPAAEIKWIKSYAKVLDDEQGNSYRMVGLNWDISRLKQTEEMLRRNNEELLKTNNELDHFVYSTSHNLRAPLTSILGIVNLIKSAPDTADYALYTHLIEKSVTKLDETIQEITDYSRNTRVEVVFEEVDFESIIREVIESLSFIEQAEKIRISYVIPDNSCFISDSSRLKMIFTNLLSNAIKYYDAKQKDPFILIVIEQKEQGVFIRIKDNGIGIAAQHQDRIFKMFFRASSKSTGSGLGLYIVREAIHKLGGTIAVESRPGEGTEFILFLPNPE
jgi:PAS domain S-box-containing protein